MGGVFKGIFFDFSEDRQTERFQYFALEHLVHCIGKDISYIKIEVDLMFVR